MTPAERLVVLSRLALTMSEDERVSAFVTQVRKRAIGAKVTGILRGIADMTDAIVRGEGAE